MKCLDRLQERIEREGLLQVLREWRWRMGGILVAVVSVASLLVMLDARRDAGRQRYQENRRSIVELCDAINVLPENLGRAVALRDRRIQVLGITETTMPPEHLTPEEVAELAEIDRLYGEVLHQLSEPIECYPRED